MKTNLMTGKNKMNKILVCTFALLMNAAGTMLGAEIVGEPKSGFALSPSGAGTYSIEVECPPGVNGMEPTLSLIYNSQGGQGLAGWGWNVGGLSAITKSCPNIYFDNVSKPINSDLSGEQLALDGQRLVKEKTIDSLQTEFRTENDALNRIVRKGKDGAFSFSVYCTDGREMKYSQLKTGASYYKGNLGWYVTEVCDRHGNYVTYTYGTTLSDKNIQEVTLKKIAYGGNRTKNTSHCDSLLFSYASATPIRYYMDGQQKLVSRRLSTITAYSKGTTYRKYTLQYKTNAQGRDLLSKVMIAGNNGDTYKDITMSWNEVKIELTERSMDAGVLSQEAGADQKIWIPVDYDHDGYTDLLCYYELAEGSATSVRGTTYRRGEQSVTRGSSSSDRLEYYHNDNGVLKFKENLPLSMNGSFSTIFSTNFSQGFPQNFFISINGRESRLYLHNIEKNSSVLLTELTDYDAKSPTLPLYAVGDFNRDGYGDIAVLELKPTDNKYPLTVFFGANLPDLFDGGEGVIQKKTYNVPLSSTPRRLYATDLNVDGNLDFLILTEKGYWVYKNTSAKSASLTLKAALSNTTSETVSELKVADSFRCVEPGDFNGDGKLDFFIGGPDKNYFMMGKSDFSFEKKEESLIEKLTSDGDFAVVNDFDQDGRSDVVTFRKEGRNVTWYRSRGDYGFSKVHISTSVATNWKRLTCGQVVVADFTGDGRAELFSVNAPCVSSVSEQDQSDKFYLSGLASAANGAMLASVATPTKSTSINYVNLLTKQKNTSNIALPANVTSFMPSIWVVSSTVVNGAKTTYEYEDALFERTGKGFLGFAKTTATSAGLSVRNESKLNASPTFLNAYRTSILKGTEEIRSTTLTTQVVLSGRKYKVWTTKCLEKDNLKGTSKTSTFSSHNSYGIPATTVVDFGAGVKETTTLSDFKINQTYNSCLPQKKTVKKSNSSGSFSNTETYGYNDKLEIVKMVRNVGTDLAVTETRTYDDFGNLTSVKTVADDCEDRTTSYAYTASGRFLASVTAHDGTKTTITNDEKYCRPTKTAVTRGAIVHTTSYLAYDGFNNCLNTKYPDGRVDTLTLCYGAGLSHNQCQLWEERKCAGEPTVRKFYKAGKVQFVASLAMDGKWREQIIDYDAYGRLYRRSQVYQSNASNLANDTYNYDAYGRLTEANEIGGKTTYAYNGLKTTVTSPAGIKVLEYNAAGQLIKSTENGHSVTFEYYPSGLLKKATPQDGGAVTMAYDVAGNRTKLVDPDAGEIEWEYDSYGREISTWQKKVSPNRRTYTTYDDLGRMASVEGAEWQVNYTYDAAGRIVEEVNHIDESKKSYAYDNYGRVTKCVESIPGKSLTTTYAYAKTYGDATKVTYPSGYAVTNVYDDYGNLTTVKNGETTIWQWRELDKQGRMTKDAICGSVVRTCEYDVAGKILSETAYKDNVGLMHLTYGYEEDDEEGGALAPVERKDQISGNKEQIGYADNQIYTLSVSNRMSGTGGYYTYDNQGNLTGTYEHRWNRIGYGTDGATPHQISMVGYDSRFAPRGERKLVFNSTLWKAKKVTEAGLTYEYLYGSDKQRFRTQLKRGSKVLRTRYYTPNYELEIDSLAQKREVHYIYGANGLAAIFVKNAGKDSLFAVATDRQGSLMATMHTASGKVERYSYDPFGRRRSADNWLQSAKGKPRFDRGYCLHEHVPEMDMIDMNGRLYDPTLCQFLSPDPYIQDPTNWQNYNRYAYCLQNPMLYTDPSGEKVAWWTAIATTILCPMPGTLNGLANVYCNKESGYIQHSSDMWKCYGQGVLVGTVVPVSITSSTTINLLPVYTVATIVSWICNDFDNGIFENSFKIVAGNSYVDGDTNFWKGIWYGISANTFESVQNSLGSDFMQLRNSFGYLDRVDYLDGMTFGTKEHSSHIDGITMGTFSNIRIKEEITGDFKTSALTLYNGLYMHEYGHFYQSRNYGLAYLFYIGIPSLYSVLKGHDYHSHKWYEIEASYYGKRYFTQKYGDDIWKIKMEDAHPTHKK